MHEWYGKGIGSGGDPKRPEQHSVQGDKSNLPQTQAIIDKHGLIEKVFFEDLSVLEVGDMVLCISRYDPYAWYFGFLRSFDREVGLVLFFERTFWRKILRLPEAELLISKSQLSLWRLYLGTGAFSNFDDIRPYFSDSSE
jgi:hypothetical protein